MTDAPQLLFKAGDVVQLKSGGPPMTVRGILTDRPWVATDWFGPTGTLNDSSFPATSLEIIKSDPTP